MKHYSPTTTFPCRPDDLYRALCFGDAKTLANELDVTPQKIERWRRGRDPVPKLVHYYLTNRTATTLGEQFGPFRDFRLSNRADALVCPSSGVRINYAELQLLAEYRRAHKLAQQQAELIETLMRERDYYRQNCHRDARYGMLLNGILGNDNGIY
ncbi:hypothetical protein VA599_10720 [Chromobacterium sp. TRC.1.1.SA]|uniref:Transcriptional regulator n=1 Tax=Chromobacterium indicum TaxID=3110228 RepID=A0ABV0CJ63_9NEIS|nr:helix-turn-helix domain-containing protein [Chromobacterium vaccinii]MBX9355680.1 helix-turn-helix domain-containing protein [Chromobacterium vaccinii]